MRLLPLGMVVRRKIHDVRFQMSDDFGLLLVSEALPIGTVRTVGFREFLLADEH